MNNQNERDWEVLQAKQEEYYSVLETYSNFQDRLSKFKEGQEVVYIQRVDQSSLKKLIANSTKYSIAILSADNAVYPETDDEQVNRENREKNNRQRKELKEELGRIVGYSYITNRGGYKYPNKDKTEVEESYTIIGRDQEEYADPVQFRDYIRDRAAYFQQFAYIIMEAGKGAYLYSTDNPFVDKPVYRKKYIGNIDAEYITDEYIKERLAIEEAYRDSLDDVARGERKDSGKGDVGYMELRKKKSKRFEFITDENKERVKGKLFTQSAELSANWVCGFTATHAASLGRLRGIKKSGGYSIEDITDVDYRVEQKGNIFEQSDDKLRQRGRYAISVRQSLAEDFLARAKKNQFAIISGFVGYEVWEALDSKLSFDKYNSNNNQTLLRWIEHNQYEYQEVTGLYKYEKTGEVSEETSYIIWAHNEETNSDDFQGIFQKLGRIYKQFGVIVGIPPKSGEYVKSEVGERKAETELKGRKLYRSFDEYTERNDHRAKKRYSVIMGDVYYYETDDFEGVVASKHTYNVRKEHIVELPKLLENYGTMFGDGSLLKLRESGVVLSECKDYKPRVLSRGMLYAQHNYNKIISLSDKDVSDTVNQHGDVFEQSDEWEEAARVEEEERKAENELSLRQMKAREIRRERSEARRKELGVDNMSLQQLWQLWKDNPEEEEYYRAYARAVRQAKQEKADIALGKVKQAEKVGAITGIGAELPKRGD
ncbi:MAG: hypothetical protein LBN25_03895 [Christensenellaceae bacterium]|jgi:hypothetical protein|nr:hypothetical protein [Christensenellaceae bacterium]